MGEKMCLECKGLPVSEVQPEHGLCDSCIEWKAKNREEYECPSCNGKGLLSSSRGGVVQVKCGSCNGRGTIAYRYVAPKPEEGNATEPKAVKKPSTRNRKPAADAGSKGTPDKPKRSRKSKAKTSVSE